MYACMYSRYGCMLLCNYILFVYASMHICVLRERLSVRSTFKITLQSAATMAT